jgi:hypothetical protein
VDGHDSLSAHSTPTAAYVGVLCRYSRMPSFFVDGATAEDDAVARRVEDVDRPFLQALQWLVDTGSTDFGVGPLPTARAPKFSGCWESHGLPKTFRVSDGEAVERAVHAYRQASAVSTIDRSVRVRLLKKEGNALNVFGIGVTNSIIQLVTGGDDVAVDAKVVSLKAMAIRARGVLSKAVEAFQRAGDRFNEALVNCNLAKLMRAHAAGVVTFLPESEAVPQQRELLDLAIEYYGRVSEREQACVHPDACMRHLTSHVAQIVCVRCAKGGLLTQRSFTVVSIAGSSGAPRTPRAPRGLGLCESRHCWDEFRVRTIGERPSAHAWGHCGYVL